MRSFFLLFCIGLLGCSHNGPVRLYPGNALPPQQEAILVLPEALEIIRVNQEDVPASAFAFRTGASELRLAPGPNRLTIQYRTLWDITSDQHQVVESGPIEFAVHVKPNQTYQFEWQPPTSLARATAFANNPKIAIGSNNKRWQGQHKPRQSDLILIADPVIKNQDKAGIALDKLQYWWQRANLDEQQAFRQVIEAQN